MKIPELTQADKYIGLYVIDFGDHTGVGFTANEVARLLESEKYSDITVYKIYNARPDGKMELRGINNDTFHLEMGMFFYAPDESSATEDFKQLRDLAARAAPPSRAKIQLSKSASGYLTALIYPAEFNDEISKWLMDGNYRTSGYIEAGISAVNSYYSQELEILDRSQLLPAASFEDLTGMELLEAATRQMVR